MDEIGARAGISGPAIYRHFEGKDEILAALFESASTRLLLRTDLSSPDPAERLEAMIRGQVEWSLAEGDLLGVYAREDRSLVDPWRRAIRRREREHIDRWIRVIGGCHPHASELDVRTAAYAVNGLLLSIAWWPRALVEADGAAARACALCRNALATLRPAELVAGPE